LFWLEVQKLDFSAEYVILKPVKKYALEEKTSQEQLSLQDFMASYNTTMPASFPRVTVALLEKFKESHEALFKTGDTWSLDIHRKKLIDWIPRNTDKS
jgi:hypothetical protein